MINDGLPVGATPLTPDDSKGLIPSGISTRGQLDQFESRNIQQALSWAFRGNRAPDKILTLDFCQSLHKRMFDKTWQWAGLFRRYEVNIGNTPPLQVSMSLRNLCDDAKVWVECDTYPREELCVRFHHRMVWIHPYPNGNGRHSRIMADILAKALGLPMFTWGSANLMWPGKSRIDYIAGLQAADAGDYGPLMAFAQS
ncbi:mobile mystery protein B [Microbulbifer rhizosphaerae]|uniref:Fic-DOC domain mobile mystery protein B n=1 Tax=Microbulbifer rhizosphaerae TaxID=1562603 RepID=A0A7W4ZB46_9GAMM|nr:mobile mystery protein B [Microbulbifer rhizosphaerae]MBB3063507.1 Fic-DOC domain mobile mystery protein B [Microbulbifer rhizosphaerae]